MVRKKTLLILGAIVCAVALIVTGVLTVPSLLGGAKGEESKPSQPDEWTVHFFSLVGNGKYEELYGLLTEESKTRITSEEFLTKYKNIYGGIEAANITVAVQQVSDYEDATGAGIQGKKVDYSLRMDTAAGEISYTGQAIFYLDENKEYRLDWSPQMIFPALTWEGRVRVNNLSAERGGIFDRNGEMLAGKGVASSVGFVPGKMRKADDAPVSGVQDTPEGTPAPSAASTEQPESAAPTEPPEAIPESIYNAEDTGAEPPGRDTGYDRG